MVADADFLFHAQFKRAGSDLVLSGNDGRSLRIADYFKDDTLRALQSSDGATIAGELVAALAGPVAPGQYAGTVPKNGAAAIGKVAEVSGRATVVRNGVEKTLEVGDVVLKGDVLQTAADGKLGIVLTDGSAFQIAPDSRLVLSEYAYTQGGSERVEVFHLVQGSFSFISGDIAKSGGMKIGTPLGTLKIDGTAGGGDLTSNLGQITLYIYQQNDGKHQATLLDQNGNPIATISSDGGKLIVTPNGPSQYATNEQTKTDAEKALEQAALDAIQKMLDLGRVSLLDISNPQPAAGGPVGSSYIPFGGQVTPDGGPPVFTPITVVVPDLNNGAGPTTTFVDNPDINDAPVATPDTYTLAEDGILVVQPKGVLANDTDPDGDPLTVTLLQGPQHGTLTFNDDGSFVYQADPNYNGPDSFTYRASDGTLGSQETLVSLNVLPVNDAPVLALNTENGGGLTAVEQTPLALTPNLTLTDIDSTTLAQATVQISGNYQQGEDVLSFTDTLLIHGEFNAATGAMTLTAQPGQTPTLADFEAALRTVTYEDTSDTPSTLQRTLTFTVQDPDGTTLGGQDTTIATVTLDVTPVNDPAILSSDTRDLTETDSATDISATGTLTISDVDSPATFQPQTDTQGTYGKFSIGTDGAWTYVADSEHNEFQDGVTYTDVFNVLSEDGTPTTVTINILGTNDAAVLSSDTLDLTETDSATDISTTGTLTISDVDSPEVFQAQTDTQGLYGKFSIGTDGAWTYVADSEHNEFKDGVTYTDTFSVSSDDGTTTSVTIKILGTNDAAVLSLAEVNLIEANNPGAISTGGTLTISDVDSPETFQTQTDTQGLYGKFSIGANGAWTYVADSAHDEFVDGVTYTDTFSVSSDDGTTTSVAINILGTPDGATMSFAVVDLTETDSPTDISTSGTLTISDPDSPETFQVQNNTQGLYGKFSIDADGNWTYVADSAHNEFKDGVTYSDLFIVRSFDDTATSVTIKIVGTNDAALLSSADVLLTETNSATDISTSGTLTISDVDSPETFVAQVDTAGTYGKFSIGTDGAWTYVANSAHNEFNEFTTYVDTFTVASNDGTLTSVTINIKGTNDAAVLSSDTRLLTETNSATDIGANGTLTISDVDSAQEFVPQTDTQGSYGKFSIGTDGAWTYVADSAHNEFNEFTTYQDVFTVSAADGTLTSVTINIKGTNDAAVLSADVRNLTETNSATDISTSGTLTISDVDSTQEFAPQTDTQGLYGKFSIGFDGAWTYVADTAHNEFVDGITYTDIFSVASIDGTLTSVMINILGTNDAAVLSADVRNLTETNSATDISTSGTLTTSDVDNPATFVAQIDTAGLYGKFSIGTDGAWTYVANNAHNEFVNGVTYTDIFSVAAADGTLTSVTVDILGTNDAAILSSDTKNLVEGDSFADISATGTLTISDVDSAQAFVVQNETQGAYGKFWIDANGAWDYIADSAHNEFVKDQIYTDTFLVEAADGTLTSVTINMKGTNDAATNFSYTSVVVWETNSAADISAGGTITFSDPDSPTTFQPQTDVQGLYGKFSIAADGTWTYVADNAHNEFAQDVFYTDTFNLVTADGTTTAFSMEIRGTNDAPVIARAYGYGVVSTDGGGNPGNDDSGTFEVITASANGKYVLFTSKASNLIVGDVSTPNAPSDVFLKNVETGEIQLVSRDSSGNQLVVNDFSANLITNGSFAGSLSNDGRYVAFTTNAKGVAGDTNASYDVYLKDLLSGELTLVSHVLGDQNTADGIFNTSQGISGNGRYVFFASYSPNLVAGDPGGFGEDLFRYDRTTGNIEWVTVDHPNDGFALSNLGISGDGRYVAFCTGSNSYVRDMDTGTETLLGNYNIGAPELSATGQFVTYTTFDSGNYQIIWRDLVNNVTKVVVSSPSSNLHLPSSPDISPSGRYVVFTSDDDALTPGDTGNDGDLFRWDETTGTITRVTSNGSDVTVTGIGRATVDDDGNVLFTADDSALVPGDTNGKLDVISTHIAAPVTVELNDQTQVATNGAPSGAVGTLVSELVGLLGGSPPDNVSDVDLGAVTGIAITSADTTHGKWWYSLNNGTTWTEADSLTALHSLTLPADGQARVYFQTTDNMAGTLDQALVFRAWDQTTGSPGTYADTSFNGDWSAYSADVATAKLTVTPNANNAPVLIPNAAYVLDTFTSSPASYSLNAGTASWVGSWIEVGEPSQSPTANDIQIVTDTAGGAGNLSLRLRDGSDNAEDWIQRTVDLGGATSATLTFDYRRQGLETNLDQFSVDVSTDGGNTWNPVYLIMGPDNDSGYVSATANLTSYISSATIIRFDAPSSLDNTGSPNGNDTAFIDNVKVSYVKGVNLDTVAEDAGAPGLGAGTLVSNLIDFPGGGGHNNVTDADSAVTGIALTNVDISQGTWLYSLDNGAHWNAVGSVSNANALLLAADSDTRIYFQANANFNGTINDAITFRAWDQSTWIEGIKVDVSVNGGSTAFSTASEVGNITVTATEDAPVAVDDTIGTVSGSSSSPPGSGWTEWAVANGGNGHFYKLAGDYVTSVSWSAAKVAAEAAGGYLATVTSQGENDFILAMTGGWETWLGGSDNDQNDVWIWVTGPEAGLNFWNGEAAGSAPSGAYAHWNSFEPNDWQGAPENYAVMRDLGEWADYTDDSVGNPVKLYMIEWGGVDTSYYEDAPALINASTLLANDTDADGDSLSIVSVSGISDYGATVSYSNGVVTYDPRTGLLIQQLNAGQTLTDAFTYTITDGHGNFSTATVSIVINGTSAAEPPIARNDSASVTEKGGTANGTGGSSPVTGDVRANDIDPDGTQAALNVTAVRLGAEAGSGSPGTVGQPLVGAHGTLTLNANGTYSYALNENDATVQALNVGQAITDTFTYTISDAGNLTDKAELVITINGANDAPVNLLPASLTAGANDSTVLSGANKISVSDDSSTATLTVSLAVGQGTITLNGTSGLSFSPGAGDGTADAAMTFSGTKAAINAALNGLSYTPTGGYTGADTLQIVSNDGEFSDTDSLSISVVDNQPPVWNITGGDASFDTFTGWQNSGLVTKVTAPTSDGHYAALIQSGAVAASTLESGLGLASGTLGTLVPYTPTAGSATSTAVYLKAGQTIGFDWFFQPGDSFSSGSGIDDFAFFTVGSSAYLLTDLQGSSPYTWQHTEYTAVADGLYTLGFGVTDTGDASFNSTLYVDNITGIAHGSVKEDASAAATGPNLVNNGGFETNDLAGTGWTLVTTDPGNDLIVSSSAHSGSNSMELGQQNTSATLKQAISTVAGKNYTISYWLTTGGGAPNSFSVSWDGVVVPGSTITNLSSSLPYTQYSFTVQATDASSDLMFTASMNPSWWWLDDVTVTEAISPTETTSGIISFTDVNVSDTHTYTVTPAGGGIGYVGTFSTTKTEANGAGQVDWTFSVDDSAIQYLAAGQTVTQTYTVAVDDGHNPPVSQDVVITINGSNDAPVLTPHTFRVADAFASANYGLNTGTVNWVGNWTETGEATDPTVGDVRIIADGVPGNFSMRLGDASDNSADSAQRVVNLAGAVSATLTFDYRRVGLDDSGDQVSASVSYDGTNFAQLALFFGGPTTDLNYQSYSVDIPAVYLTANTIIRFEGSGGLGSSDFVYIDNVAVTYVMPQTLPAINEDPGVPLSNSAGILVSSLVDRTGNGGQDNVSDPDIANPPPGIAITGTGANGTWLYLLDGGVWTPVGAVSNSQALLLPDTARLYFLPNADFSGTITDTLLFRAWDQTSDTAGIKVDTTVNGGTTAFSTAVDQAQITVNPFNDAPTDIVWTGFAAPSGSSLPGASATLANLSSVDVDNASGFTYSLLAGSSAGFAVSAGGVVTTTAAMTANTTYTLIIQSQDAGGALYSETFNIITGDSGINNPLPAGGSGDAILAGDDILYGHAGADAIFGGANNDTLYGQDGNDSLDGGTGNDNYIFGLTDGTDTIAESGGSADKITIMTGGAALTALNAFDDNSGTTNGSLVIQYNGQQVTVGSHFVGGNNSVELINFNNGTYAGYSFGTGDYAVSSSDPSNPTARTGAAGVNSLIAGEQGSGNVLTGSSAADLIFGGNSGDTIDGGAGNNLIVGGGGNDSLTGGVDNDTYVFGLSDGTDTVSDAFGTDAIVIKTGGQAMSGLSAFDNNTGTSTGDLVIQYNGQQVTLLSHYTSGGNPAFETIAFDGGSVYGYSLGTGTYAISRSDPSGATRTVTLTNINNFAAAEDGSTNSITGGTANDLLFGGTGVDTLVGGSGSDLLVAGGGATNTLTGGTGADVMVGGSGTDTFNVASGDSTASVTGSGDAGIVSGFDIIVNFSTAVDKLNLHGATVVSAGGNFSGGDGPTNSVLTINGQTVKTHSVTNGVITFDDATTFSAGGALVLTSLANVAAVVQYLQSNTIGGTAGTTLAFTATINSVNHTFLYTQGGTTNAGTNSLVDLSGVTISNLTTLIGSGNRIDPIVLDLGHDGISFTSAEHGVSFDIDADGIANQMAWTAGDDGILALDVNHSGSIDDGSEIFSPFFGGGQYAHGLEALATLDTNNDGKIDAQDAQFADLLVWQDKNHDGLSTADELASLPDHGITSISLQADATDETIDGQQLLAEGTFTNADGTTGHYVEVAFETAPAPAPAAPPTSMSSFLTGAVVDQIPHDSFDFTDFSASLVNAPKTIEAFASGDTIHLGHVLTSFTNGLTAQGSGDLALDLVGALTGLNADGAAEITITTGNDAGIYAIINDAVAGFQAAHDAVVKLNNGIHLHQGDFVV